MSHDASMFARCMGVAANYLRNGDAWLAGASFGRAIEYCHRLAGDELARAERLECAICESVGEVRAWERFEAMRAAKAA